MSPDGIVGLIMKERRARQSALSQIEGRIASFPDVDEVASDLRARISKVASSVSSQTGIIQTARDRIEEVNRLIALDVANAKISIDSLSLALADSEGRIDQIVAQQTETARLLAEESYAFSEYRRETQAKFYGSEARIVRIEQAYVDEDEAIAIATEQIVAALTGPSGSIYAAVETEASARVAADGQIHARWGVSIDVNGNIVGRINLDGTNESSSFTIDVDKFTVANSSLDIVPFQIVGSKARFTSDVEIDGSLILTGTLSLTDLSDKSLANLDSTANSKLAGIASGADVTLSAVNGGLLVTGGGITLDGGGALKGGASSFASGTGFFLGYEGGAYKFRVGDPAGARIEWDGSSWTVVSFPGGGSTTYSLTVNWHPSGTGGGYVNGAYYSGTSSVISGLNPGGWVTIEADASVGGDGFAEWDGSAFAEGQLESAIGTNPNRILMGGDITITASY